MVLGPLAMDSRARDRLLWLLRLLRFGNYHSCGICIVGTVLFINADQKDSRFLGANTICQSFLYTDPNITFVARLSIMRE